MTTIADLVIRLSANTAGAEKSLTGAGAKIQRGLGKALVPAGIALGVLAVGFKKTTDAATGLGEATNAVNVVFGKGAAKIHAFAKIADKEVGLSMRSLKELVTPLGAAFINMGDSQQVAADKSLVLARRAADMASVFNVPVKDALGAVQAALRGESDPIERFGVGLNEAAVSAQAMKMGLAKIPAELTAQDKAQARYALLLAQTNRLQGDFKNTSGEAANAARINAAAQENLTAKIGTGLLPVVKAAQKVFGALLDVMARHPGVITIVAGALGVLAVAIIALNVVMAVAASVPLMIIVALVALGAALVLLWVKCETFRNIVTAAWEGIKAVTAAVWPTIKAILLAWFNAVKGIFMTYFNAYKTIVMAAIAVIKTTIATIRTVVAVVVSAFEAVKSATSTAWNAVKSVITSAVDAIKSKVSSGFNALAGIVRGVVGAVRSAANAIKSAFQPILDIIQRIIDLAGRAVSALAAIGSAASKVASIPGKLGSIAGKAKFWASGTSYHPGGMAVVGERGPELVNLNRGASVFSNSESRTMLGGAGGGPLIGEVHVHDNADIELLARRVQRVLAFG